MKIGDELELEIGPVAHGGHFVARFEGRVVFVRHAITGERVIAKITEISKRFARADCVKVISPSQDRIQAECAYARPNGCGGCDFQHISPRRQRELKSQIIKEQFKRLANLEVDVLVEEVPPAFGWRTRMEFNISKTGKVSMFKSRSNELIEIESCKLADPKISIESLNSSRLAPGSKIEVVVDGLGNLHSDLSKTDRLPYFIDNQKFEVSFESFWQSHKSAPSLLTKVVTELSEYRPNDHVIDLYAGIGILSSPSLKTIGIGGRLTLIEESESAISDAKWNYSSASNVEFRNGRVEKEIQKLSSCDLVILDPPRAGAGAKVLNEITRLAPRTIVYVACDPAALARDAGFLTAHSYEMDTVRAFDLFPMTQHMECVARFIRS